MGWLSKVPFLKNFLREEKQIFHRDVRICLFHADVYFKPLHSSTDGMLTVANISFGGIGIVNDNLMSKMSVGEIIPGKLFLKDSSFDVSIKIIHFQKEIVGCGFVSLPEGFDKKLKDFFWIEFAAHRLVQINHELLTHPADGVPYYFHGLNRDELYFVIKDDRVILFNLIIAGKFLSGGFGQPIKMGEIVVDVSEKVHGYKRIDPVHWSNDIDSSFIAQAKTFIDNVEMLAEEHRLLLISTLDQ